jgi:hypothetical protein
MESIKSKKYLTQIADLAIEERSFFKTAVGASISEHYREATDEELAQWEELKKKQEEEHQAMMGHESSNA